jgi:hypothetical protein
LETRQATLWMQLYGKYSELEMSEVEIELLVEWTWSDYDDFMEKYGQRTNPKAYSKFVTMGNYFEGVGMLVGRGLIGVEMVYDLMWSPITEFWEKFSPVFIEMRNRSNLPKIGTHTEYLYNEIKKIEPNP